jgi:L-ribulose-5-phosphate 3-epimerase/hexulose-6-phosphate isomerase
MGTGIADFPAAFAELERQNWSGRMMIEMWNDDSLRSSAISADARVKIEGWLSAAGIQVVSR